MSSKTATWRKFSRRASGSYDIKMTLPFGATCATEKEVSNKCIIRMKNWQVAASQSPAETLFIS
jgi:hypothetical protein